MSIVLVTGGAGYIGSHVCKALASSGHRPVACDDLSRGREDHVRWGPFEQGDIADADWLASVFARHRPDAIMHLAAYAEVGSSVTDPSPCYAANVSGTLAVIEAARHNGNCPIVFSSTCAVYGDAPALPVTEASPTAPVSPYGTTKLIGEQALRHYDTAYGLPSVVLRYFNAAGADPDGEIGERHATTSLAIPKAIRAALGLGPVFKLFGTDYATADGTAMRDYVHVADIADAHLRALGHLLAGRGSLTLNLGSGRSTTVLELLEVVEAVIGRPVPVEPHPRRSGDAAALYANIDRAADVLGWTPGKSDLRSIVASAAAWIEKSPG
ncbi:UDP-glucose 4-epimerase GalE [Labrys sp. LIt4]|uniref:UDP-glucose 4-epimerase GalE n=1 Tax=Labrys sp. LIt4 TaxID=2821355 RepID=UPI001AE030D0|nr:UDP-glucose 4-epimerase GalE [Labrys sp. LIt4]MBP0582890.1 UDP-glucose 4-epimerase GalE [Labrys sp. LIt4]